MNENIAMLGSGIMGGIWIERLLAVGAATPDQVMACDPNMERLDELKARFGISVSGDNSEGARFGDLVILAPPPPATIPVLEEIASALSAGKIVISLSAGVPVAALESHVPEGTVVMRVMPNTPSLVGAGLNPVVFAAKADEGMRDKVLALLGNLGDTIEISDAEMNAVCALCAVGPTYLFPVVDALGAAAAQHGLDAATALRASATLMSGVGTLVRDTGKSPDELKQMISLRTIDEGAVSETFTRAYEEAFAKLEGLQSKLAGGST